MAIRNYTTDVDYWKSIGEIQAQLFKYGASHVNLKAGPDGPEAITFTMELEGQPFNFLLSCERDGILASLKEARYGKLDGAKTPGEKALRVGWRIVKDWIGAQMAFIEARKAQDRTRALITVFLPYAVSTTGETLADKLLGSSGSALKKIGY